MQFTLNGRRVRVDANPLARLLDVLREDFRLTGTKEGCGEGECGACSVFINGELVNSCLVPVAQADGAEITTIEGIATGDQLHAVQQAFLTHEAMQCGYCTPGMIMAAVALLSSNPHPTDDAIVKAMDKNVCRCGTYPRIVAAIKDAANG